MFIQALELISILTKVSKDTNRINVKDFRIFGAKNFPQSSLYGSVFLDPDQRYLLRRIPRHGNQRV